MAVEIAKVTIEGDSPGPHLVILGGVHGDEFEPMEAIRWLIEEIPSFDMSGSVTLVPVANEPAFVRGTRTADDGLDLARTFPGSADGTITQQVAHAVTEIIESADAMIDLHTGGTQLTAAPLTGYMLHSDNDILSAQRAMALAFNLPIVWGTSAELDGRSLSVCRDARIPAIYAEYLGGGGCSANGVVAYVDGCLHVMRHLKMIERLAVQSHVRVHREDARPNSGHMQICHPAPGTGYFAPHIQLGDHVDHGAPLGVITDPVGRTKSTISAAQSGEVIVLRTFPRVLAGDGLVVLLSDDATDLREGATRNE